MKDNISDGKTDVQSLMNKKDVALISDSVSSREELIGSLMKYLKLPRPERRLSDYYSVKLFGCNVANMFLTMSYRFKPESPIPVNETFLISEPDLYYNKKAFDEGLINLCFVIGYSGSGKSVLTSGYKGKGIEKISLDDIVCVKDHFTLEELKESGDMLYSFFAGPGKKYYISREERNVFANHGEVFISFIDYAREYAAAHMEKKFILEGIWTYLFFDDPSEFDGYAVFMKGTSLVKSRLRRIMREAENDVTESLDRLLDFGVYAADTTFRDINVDKWRRHFEKKKETSFKQEENYFSAFADSIMTEFDNINDRFAHGDEHGIRLIMDNASNNKDMPIAGKTIIIEECKRALADLASGMQQGKK